MSNIHFNNKFIYLLLLTTMMSCDVTKRMIHKHIEKDYVLVDDLYWCKYEVTNKEYNLFLKELKQQDVYEYEKCIRTSERWYDEDIRYNTANAMERNYSTHPAFENYPVVNIPYYGAQKYGEWLSDKAQKYTFRIPTKNEFQSLLRTVTIKYGSNSKEDYNVIHFNMKFIEGRDLDGGELVVKSKLKNIPLERRLLQNEQGMFNIIGNVSELVQENESIGGSWNSYPGEANRFEKYKGPNARTGFRVVFENNY